MARAMLVLSALGLTGCNQVFGLEETKPTSDAHEIDHDHDGVLDVIDNCPDVANPLQENQDGDAFGDACDPCVSGANSDEDGDQLLDGCDNCPHITNPTQDNADGDALGDACDPDNTIVHTRSAFDGFAEPLTLVWIPEVAEWETVDGAAHAKVDLLSYEIGMWSRFVEVSGTTWLIETAVSADDTAITQHVGLYTRTRNGALDHACYLARTAQGWMLQMAVNDPANPTVPFTTMAALASLPPAPVRLRLQKVGNTIVCDIPGMVQLSIASTDTRTGAGFFATTAAQRFFYIEAVGSQ